MLGQFYPDLGIILLNGTSMDDVPLIAEEVQMV